MRPRAAQRETARPPRVAGVARPVAIERHWSPGELTIRPIEPRDRAAFGEAVAASRQRVIEWFPLSTPGESPETVFERQLELTRRADERSTGWRRAAFTPRGELAGCVQIFNIERGLSWSGDVSFWVAQGCTGMGVGRAMLEAAARHALGPLPGGLGLHALAADVQRDNTPALALLARVGFRHEPSGDSKLLVNDRWLEHERYTLHSIPAEVG